VHLPRGAAHSKAVTRWRIGTQHANAGDLIVMGAGFQLDEFPPTLPGINDGFTILGTAGIGVISGSAIAVLIATNTAPVNPTWAASQGLMSPTTAIFSAV
jgi:hypothetical protein